MDWFKNELQRYTNYGCQVTDVIHNWFQCENGTLKVLGSTVAIWEIQVGPKQENPATQMKIVPIEFSDSSGLIGNSRSSKIQAHNLGNFRPL